MLCAAIAAVSLVLLVGGLGVPMLGTVGLLAGVVALLVAASLGLGLLISIVSDSERQAVQLSLLVLLASVFFAGFAVPISEFTEPVRIAAYAIPATNGIVLMQDVMLRGEIREPWQAGVLAATAARAARDVLAAAAAGHDPCVISSRGPAAERLVTRPQRPAPLRRPPRHRFGVASGQAVQTARRQSGRRVMGQPDASEAWRPDPGRIVEILSHELRSPITTIHLGTRVLHEPAISAPVRREVVAAVEEETERLYRIVEDLLAVARHDEGANPLPVRPLLLQRWLLGVVDREVQAERRLRVHVGVPSDLPPVDADEAALVHVLRNLLINSARHAGDGMPVEVVVRRLNHGSVALEVLDRGPGLRAAGDGPDVRALLPRRGRGGDRLGGGSRAGRGPAADAGDGRRPRRGAPGRRRGPVHGPAGRRRAGRGAGARSSSRAEPSAAAQARPQLSDRHAGRGQGGHHHRAAGDDGERRHALADQPGDARAPRARPPGSR